MFKRGKAFKILLTATLAALAPAAQARPVKPAAHGPATKPEARAAAHTGAHASPATRSSAGHAGAHSVAARERTHSPAHTAGAHAREVRGHASASHAHAGRHAEEAAPVSRNHRLLSARAARVEARKRTTHTVAAKQVMVKAAPEPQKTTVAKSPVGESVVARSVAPAPAQQSGQAAEPEVRHDRRHHLADPAANANPSTTTQPAAEKQPGAAPVVPREASGSAPAQASLFTRTGRLIMPPAMKGTHEILIHQNVMADQDGLARVQDDADLERMRASKLLVAIPQVPGLQADERLPANRRYARPWTAEFLAALARAHWERFHTPLQVNSAVRTVEFQRNLIHVNGNAAPAEGETASPHLTGQAVDLAKKGLSLTEIAWMRGYLLPLVQQGKVDVEEEFQQSCFHISVYKKYQPEASPKREIAARSASGAALATAMR